MTILGKATLLNLVSSRRIIIIFKNIIYMEAVATDFGIQEALKQLGVKDIND